MERVSDAGHHALWQQADLEMADISWPVQSLQQRVKGRTSRPPDQREADGGHDGIHKGGVAA